MFDHFDRKRQEATYLGSAEFLERLTKAAAEGDRRARVNAALGTEGIIFQSTEDSTEYCVNAVVASVKEVMRRSDCDMKNISNHDLWTGTMFDLIFASIWLASSVRHLR